MEAPKPKDIKPCLLKVHLFTLLYCTISFLTYLAINKWFTHLIRWLGLNDDQRSLPTNALVTACYFLFSSIILENLPTLRLSPYRVFVLYLLHIIASAFLWCIYFPEHFLATLIAYSIVALISIFIVLMITFNICIGTKNYRITDLAITFFVLFTITVVILVCLFLPFTEDLIEAGFLLSCFCSVWITFVIINAQNIIADPEFDIDVEYAVTVALKINLKFVDYCKIIIGWKKDIGSSASKDKSDSDKSPSMGNCCHHCPNWSPPLPLPPPPPSPPSPQVKQPKSNSVFYTNSSNSTPTPSIVIHRSPVTVQHHPLETEV